MNLYIFSAFVMGFHASDGINDLNTHTAPSDEVSIRSTYDDNMKNRSLLLSFFFYCCVTR